MDQAAGSLAAIAALVVAGVLLARAGMLGERAVTGLTSLITRLTLPLLLLRAFARLEPDARTAALALSVAATCAVMGVLGAVLGRVTRLPRPHTRLLFQGFEAGMLGYALFVALHGDEHLPAFAALDVGQVVFVFTALMVQMTAAEAAAGRDAAGEGAEPRPARPVLPWRDLVRSPVLWAIAVGLTLAGVAPGVASWLAAPGGGPSAFIDMVGGLTTPLVCLVIGASLAAGVPRDPAIVAVVAARTAVGLGLGLVLARVVVPALDLSPWHAKAAVLLCVLPPPFVIPVYFRRAGAFVSSALTLSTAVSVLTVAVLTVLGIA